MARRYKRALPHIERALDKLQEFLGDYPHYRGDVFNKDGTFCDFRYMFRLDKLYARTDTIIGSRATARAILADFLKDLGGADDRLLSPTIWRQEIYIELREPSRIK